MENRTYQILIDVSETDDCGAYGVTATLSEVCTEDIDAISEVCSRRRSDDSVGLLWMRWSPLRGLRVGGSTHPEFLSSHNLVMRREMPVWFERAALDGIALALRIDAGEFGDRSHQRVKASPKYQRRK